ncbi:hypothetical protein JKP88DRAFT_285521 [Tribonema minus]|uniref:Uncharacterized protein n=1 Tax=Tribonema minus TaxID=303371 RepID=A0A836CLM3_9STRA|nr:hypothetical protein JKP88DRAFT_285521 [Tribonema minus]
MSLCKPGAWPRAAAVAEDRCLLAGEVAALFGDYGLAQELMAALDMRRAQARGGVGAAAGRGAGDQRGIRAAARVPGENDTALRMFQQALAGLDDGAAAAAAAAGSTAADAAQLRVTCACCGLATGGVGVRGGSCGVRRRLLRECAPILKDMRQEAAALWDASGLFERALAIFLAARNMPMHALRGGGPVPVGHGRGNVHERAHDMDAVVRLCLDQLDQPERAFAIVSTTTSAAGAKSVSRYRSDCATAGNWGGAIEFLLMAQRADDAFELSLAQAHEQMAAVVGAQGGLGAAGRHHRALKLLLQRSEAEAAAARDVVGGARTDMLTHTLIGYLMGETDGIFNLKDLNHIYCVYLALGKYEQAAKTAIITARVAVPLVMERQPRVAQPLFAIDLAQEDHPGYNTELCGESLQSGQQVSMCNIVGQVSLRAVSCMSLELAQFSTPTPGRPGPGG